MRDRMRRLLAVSVIAAMLFGPALARARMLATITAPTQSVTVRAAHHNELTCNQEPTANAPFTPFTDQSTGLNVTGSQNMSNPGNSPELVAAPVFNSGNSTTTVWGMGWTSVSDQSVALMSDHSAIWTRGSGAELTFFNTTASSSAPSYISPINSFMTMTAVTLSSGSPTALLERDKDGTTRKFSVFESTTILRLSLLTDKNGNTIAYSRDSLGRLTHVQDVHGRYFNLTYNPAGFVATLSDSGGRTSSYSYDGQGHMTSVAGPLGTTAYQYDTSNRMTKITYPNGGVHDYTYDGQNRVLTEDDGAGQNALSYAYYASSSVVTDALGRATLYQYQVTQGLHLLTSVTDSAGHVTSYTYDSNLNMASMTDPLGRTTRYTHDANGNVTVTQDAASGLTKATYDPTFNLPVVQIDPMNRTTLLSYDGVGDLTKIQAPT